MEPAVDPATNAPAAGPRLLTLASGFYAIVVLFAVGFALFSGEVGTLLGERPFPGVLALLSGIAIGGALVALTRIGVRVWPAIERAAATLAEMLGPLSTKQAIALALWSGIAEELLFRGALWGPLGLAGTTCLFALVHIVPRKALWGYPLFALVGGLMLGLLRAGTESVLPPILAHVTINAINLAWLGKHHARLVAEVPATAAATQPPAAPEQADSPPHA